jgi:Transposase DDE domain
MPNARPLSLGVSYGAPPTSPAGLSPFLPRRLRSFWMRRAIGSGTSKFDGEPAHPRRGPAHCPNMPARRIVRDVNEDARDVARALTKTEAYERSRRNRKRVGILFAHLKRILKLGRLRLRGPCGAQDEFTLAAIAQNLRRLAKLAARPPPALDACLA